MKERIEYIDLAKGICIFLVVLDHISVGKYFSGGDYPMNDIFMQTRMPLYFILSGLFFKDYDGGIREFLLRKTNRILVPYLFFMIVYQALAKLMSALTSIDTTAANITGIWAPLWFLLCLFWMNAIFATLYYIIKRFIPSGLTADVALGGCVLAIGIAGYYAGDLPMNIGTAMTSLPFLWIGYLLNRRLRFFQLSIKWQWALLLGIGLIAVLHYTYMGENFFYLNTYSSPLLLVYLAGLLGTLGILLLSRVIKWLPIISYIGRYSIIVLCTHMAVMKVVLALLSLLPKDSGASCWSTLWQNNAVQSWTVLALTIAGCVFCCWLLHNYLPWFTAQKDLIKIGSQKTQAS